MDFQGGIYLLCLLVVLGKDAALGGYFGGVVLINRGGVVGVHKRSEL